MSSSELIPNPAPAPPNTTAPEPTASTTSGSLSSFIFSVFAISFSSFSAFSAIEKHSISSLSFFTFSFFFQIRRRSRAINQQKRNNLTVFVAGLHVAEVDVVLSVQFANTHILLHLGLLHLGLLQLLVLPQSSTVAIISSGLMQQWRVNLHTAAFSTRRHTAGLQCKATSRIPVML
jgi:hypothetical protein